MYDAEEVILASGMEASAINGFLQENYLDFITEDATEELAASAEYLSAAGKFIYTL